MPKSSSSSAAASSSPATGAPDPSSLPELVLRPGAGVAHYWRDLFRYRELFWFLAWRDVAVRYKQTVLGLAWSVIRPLLTMGIFSLLFGRIAKLPSEGVPYPLLVLVGTLAWTFFSSAVSESSASLVTSANMVSKVWFPRMIVPVAASIVALVDLLVSLVILVGALVWYRFVPGWQLLLLPVFLLMAVAAAIGPGLFLAALNVKYRDFRYIVPFVVQVGLYVSPVGFSSAVVPERWRVLFSLNPMAGVIDGLRWSILAGKTRFDWSSFLPSLAVTALFLVLGELYFRRTERSFADVI